MPKILRIINRFNLGGPILNASYLSSGLDEYGYETFLIGGKHENGETSATHIPESEGVHFEVLSELQRSIHPAKDYAAYKKLRKIIRQFQPDIVHTHAAKAGALGRLAAHHEGVSKIYHTFHGHVFHSYFGKGKTSFFLRLERYLASKSTKIIAISEIQKKELHTDFQIAPADTIEVVPLGFDLEKFINIPNSEGASLRKELCIPADALVLTCLGRLTAIKNQSFLLSVFEKMLPSYPQLHLVLVGDGEDREALLKQKAGFALEVQNHIHFAGWRKDIRPVLSASNGLVLTSLNEGTPVSLIEGQAAGISAISSDVGGVRDILHPSLHSFLFPSGDAAAFEERMKKWAAKQSQNRSKDSKLQDFVLENHSKELLCRSMDSLYRL